jgi:3-oxoacyl-[acyl-carrier protein] reductase
VELCIDVYGRVDILANVAGASNREKNSIEDTREGTVAALLSVNLIGTFLCMKYAVRHMKAQRYGRIINVASIAAFYGLRRGNAPYSASKGAVVSLTTQAVADLSAYGITANAVAPGTIRTAMIEQRGDDWFRQAGKDIPMRRVGAPEDVAAAIAYLGSDDARYVTGQVITVDGGLTASLFKG